MYSKRFSVTVNRWHLRKINRKLGANLPVELAHVLPEYGAGDGIDERVCHGVYNKQSTPFRRHGNANTVQPEWQPTRNKDDGDYEQ